MQPHVKTELPQHHFLIYHHSIQPSPQLALLLKSWITGLVTSKAIKPWAFASLAFVSQSCCEIAVWRNQKWTLSSSTKDQNLQNSNSWYLTRFGKLFFTMFHFFSLPRIVTVLIVRSGVFTSFPLLSKINRVWQEAASYALEKSLKLRVRAETYQVSSPTYARQVVASPSTIVAFTRCHAFCVLDGVTAHTGRVSCHHLHPSMNNVWTQKQHERQKTSTPVENTQRSGLLYLHVVYHLSCPILKWFSKPSWLFLLHFTAYPPPSPIHHFASLFLLNPC